MESKDMPEIEVAVGVAWLWEKFGKEMTQFATGAVREKWKSFKYQSAAETYAQKMKKRYGIMQLWRMSEPTSVEQIYTRVNTLKKQSAFQNIPKEKLEQIYLNQKGFGEVVEADKDGMLAVREHDRLFILGKPGAGKTTFLKHITLEAIAGKLEAIPIFIRLREFSECKQDLMDFIIAQFDICNFPEAQPFIETILKKGKAIVLFDGLDEVNKEHGLRDKVIQSIKNFSDKYDQSKVVITCRVAASEYNLEGFISVEMADFNDEQIKIFVTRWFAKNLKMSEDFFKAFAQYPGSRLHDLAKNPLLLTLLCISFEETLHFSERRSEIYGEALNALLQKRDSSRGIKRGMIYTKLSLARKHQMFARIAAETFGRGEYLFEKKALIEKIEGYLKNLSLVGKDEEIDGEAILRDIEAQHGIFVERSKGLYSFAHLSFQEYYAAQYIIAQPESRLLHLMKYVSDPRWREVFLLTAEMLGDADGFFELFIKELDQLALMDSRLKALLLKGRGASFGERRDSVFSTVYTAFTIGSMDHSTPFRFKLQFRFLHGSRVIPRTLPAAIFDAYKGSESVLAFLALDFSVGQFSAAARSYFSEALSLSEQQGDDACHSLLRELSLPSKDASTLAWRKFSDALYGIFKTTFRLEDYEFTKEELSLIINYLKANKLLLDCLKVAYVSDREGIENRLLRPVKTVMKESQK